MYLGNLDFMNNFMDDFVDNLRKFFERVSKANSKTILGQLQDNFVKKISVIFINTCSVGTESLFSLVGFEQFESQVFIYFFSI